MRPRHWVQSDSREDGGAEAIQVSRLWHRRMGLSRASCGAVAGSERGPDPGLAGPGPGEWPGPHRRSWSGAPRPVRPSPYPARPVRGAAPARAAGSGCGSPASRGRPSRGSRSAPARQPASGQAHPGAEAPAEHSPLRARRVRVPASPPRSAGRPRPPPPPPPPPRLRGAAGPPAPGPRRPAPPRGSGQRRPQRQQEQRRGQREGRGAGRRAPWPIRARARTRSSSCGP